MTRPTRIRILIVGAALAAGALHVMPAASAAQKVPRQEQTPPHTLPPVDPCKLHPYAPGCLPDLTIDPCIQYPDGECPFDDNGGDDGDDGGNGTTTTTTQPEEPTDTPDPTVPEVDDDDDGGTTTTMPSAAPATVVHASPNFTG
jgi:hypothetical protein